jgi:hypothetical protein
MCIVSNFKHLGGDLKFLSFTLQETPFQRIWGQWTRTLTSQVSDPVQILYIQKMDKGVLDRL